VHLDDENKLAVQQKTSLKRKVIDKEVNSLKSKKQSLKSDIGSPNLSADQLAEKAEKSRDISCIFQSNIM
jgi:hypothetical protein